MDAFEFGTRVVHSGKILEKCHKRKGILSVDLKRDGELIFKKSNEEKKLQECIASAECAKYALVFPSGVSAISSVVRLLNVGDHAIVFDSVYHGTKTYASIRKELETSIISFVDLRDPQVLEKYIQSNTKMVWIETPSNPTMKIVDIAAIAAIVKKYPDVFLAVDNTFMTPYFQNPLLLGADIVIHSLTKYMNGHSDVLLGAIALNNTLLYEQLQEIQDSTGVSPGPMDCYLVLRGIKTLHLRMERHMENAMVIAQYLEAHPKVEKVLYPGLKSHPQHDLALKQAKGFGGMVPFLIKGGKDEAFAFGKKLNLFHLSGSLGSTESLCDITYFMTARRLTVEQRKELGLTENFILLSVGLESVKDLISDLEQALEDN